MADRLGELQRAIRRHRRALLQGDRDAARAMVDAYARALRAIEEELAEVRRRMQLALDNGEELSRSWLINRGRLRELQAKVAEELRAFSAIAEGQTLQLQRRAIDSGLDDAELLTRQVIGTPPAGASLTWARLPATEIEAIVGATRAGPLAELFGSFAPDGAGIARDVFVRGLALGRGPAPIARELRDRLGITLARAMRISRTEMMRGYREAARASYQANRSVVTGQMWHSALMGSCAACVAMHGTILPVGAIVNGHPNCRCVGVPITKSWRDLGYSTPVEPTRIEQTGPQWFGQLPRDRQLAIVGPGKLAALEAGQVELRDLVTVQRSPTWGSMRREATLTEAIANAEARKAA